MVAKPPTDPRPRKPALTPNRTTPTVNPGAGTLTPVGAAYTPEQIRRLARIPPVGQAQKDACSPRFGIAAPDTRYSRMIPPSLPGAS